ncbi:SUKH-3 domain-containing protein [Streptomyces sp. NPDC059917]|uniref:SUKH-3 domain-containing protein n=1 Tax=Streptomyces sp. NPDC059917 TaxID=3347002 RepID=UPI0036519288
MITVSDDIPGVAASLLVQGAVVSHTNFTGDGEPQLHPAVQEFFDALPIAQRETFIGYCAESALVSDQLYGLDAQRGDGRPGTLDEALTHFAGAAIVARKIRPTAIPSTVRRPRSAAPVPHCSTTSASTSSMTGDAEFAALSAAGWQPGRDAGDAAMLAVLRTVPLGPWQLFAAAESALREFHGLRVPAFGPCRDVAPTGCVVDPMEARQASRPFNGIAEVLGVRLFPFGRTDADARLGVDELGRLFTADHGGARLLGETVHDGLTALAEDGASIRLTARHRVWNLDDRGLGAGDPIRAGARAVLVAVYVLHAHGAFSAREVRLPVTSLRGIGVLVLDQLFPLRAGRLEDGADQLAADMAAAVEATGLRP